MLQQLLQPEKMSLHDELIKKGSKVASKRLAKEKKGTFPKTGEPDDFYDWWMKYKEGKKKKKIAMVIMAFLYPRVAGYLDMFQKKVLQLENKTNSQEEEINLLKQKLLKQEAENTQLINKMSEISSEVLQLRSNRDSQKMQITMLKQRVQKQEEENTRLIDKMSEISSEVLQLRSNRDTQKVHITMLKQRVQKQEEENTRLIDKMSEISSEVLQLRSKRDNQKVQITMLKQIVQEQEEENTELTDKMSEISSDVLQLRSNRDSQKMQITMLKQRVQEQKEENKRLKDYNTTLDDSNNLLRLPGSVTSSLQKPLLSLLGELPDLQFSNSNYEFWAKIKRWLLNGEVAPQCVFELVKRKCPQKAWLTIAEDFDNKALKAAAFSDPEKAVRLLEKLWKCVSKALGPGTNMYEEYYYRTQEAGETFQTYIEEKFKLYCSFGVENTEPNKNDRSFLCNAIEKAEKRYQTFRLRCPKSYDELMNMSMIVDSMLTTAEWNNECMNCGRGGHTQAQCRRPGGDAEVGPDRCYTCGRYGHWARKCWAYQ